MKNRDAKIKIATGKLSHEVGSAQAQSAERANSLANTVEMGKRSIIFRVGLSSGEKPGLILCLAYTLRRSRRGRAPRWRVGKDVIQAAASIAIDELAFGVCPRCAGHGFTWWTAAERGTCPGCRGSGARRFTLEDRMGALRRLLPEASIKELEEASSIVKAGVAVLLEAEAVATKEAVKRHG